MPTVTEDMLKSARTVNGGFTKAQINIAREYAGKKHPIRSIVGKFMDEVAWAKFQRLGAGKREVVKSPKKEKSGRKVTPRVDENFSASVEWRALRVRVLEQYGCKCMMCGRSPKEHGVVVHIDHIKPKTTYPHLALSFSNLQILCEDCNMGKSNKYTTDWRP